MLNITVLLPHTAAYIGQQVVLPVGLHVIPSMKTSRQTKSKGSLHMMVLSVSSLDWEVARSKHCWTPVWNQGYKTFICSSQILRNDFNNPSSMDQFTKLPLKHCSVSVKMQVMTSSSGEWKKNTEIEAEMLTPVLGTPVHIEVQPMSII